MNTGTARATPDVSRAAPHADAPRHGDVVVCRESDHDVQFTVRQVPGAVQFSTAAREDALRMGRGFAEHRRVDLWQVEGRICQRLERYRPPEPETSSS